MALGVSAATGICSSCVSRRADSIVCGWRPRVLRVFRQESCGGEFFSPEGGMASQTDNLRRTTRTAWRKESRSGSSATDKAASCINWRTAKLGYWVIKNGLWPSGMPASRGILTDEETWSIVTYVRNLPRAGSLGEPPAFTGENCGTGVEEVSPAERSREPKNASSTVLAGPGQGSAAAGQNRTRPIVRAKERPT